MTAFPQSDATYGRAISDFYDAQATPWMIEVCAVVGIAKALAYFSLLCFPSPHLNNKERQESHSLPPRRVASKLPRYVISIFGALLCMSAKAELASILSIDPLDRRELVTSPTTSFAYTGTVQTWYHL